MHGVSFVAADDTYKCIHGSLYSPDDDTMLVRLLQFKIHMTNALEAIILLPPS